MGLEYRIKFVGILLLMPFWWTWLLGWAYPLAIPVVIIITGGIAVLCLRWSRRDGAAVRTLAAIVGLVAAGVCALQLLLPFSMLASASWMAWFHSGCGVTAGMTEGEVVRALEARARIHLRPQTGIYFIVPRGLASLKPMDIDINSVNVTTDASGRVLSVRTSRFF